MAANTSYKFRKAMLDDLALLTAWQASAHVSAWWDADALYDEAGLADARVARWIVSDDAGPFAYMQDYTVHGWEDHHFAHLPKGSRGIDQYIGEPAMIGIGHGSAFIRQRMRVLFDQEAPVIATDPHPENKRAIAVYEKLGFERSGPLQETQWGLIMPMLAKPEAVR